MEGKDQLVTLELPHLVRDGNHLQESVAVKKVKQMSAWGLSWRNLREISGSTGTVVGTLTLTGSSFIVAQMLCKEG